MGITSLCRHLKGGRKPVPTSSSLPQAIPSTSLMSCVYRGHCCNTMFSGHWKQHTFLYNPNGAVPKRRDDCCRPRVSIRGGLRKPGRSLLFVWLFQLNPLLICSKMPSQDTETHLDLKMFSSFYFFLNLSNVYRSLLVFFLIKTYLTYVYFI